MPSLNLNRVCLEGQSSQSKEEPPGNTQIYSLNAS